MRRVCQTYKLTKILVPIICAPGFYVSILLNIFFFVVCGKKITQRLEREDEKMK